MPLTSRDYDDQLCTLVESATGNPVETGATYRCDGDTYAVAGGRAPHKPNSSGRVYVTRNGSTNTGDLFPHTLNLEWRREAAAACPCGAEGK